MSRLSKGGAGAGGSRGRSASGLECERETDINPLVPVDTFSWTN